MKLAILLTATITPQVRGGNFSVRERLEMYTSTLRFYANVVGKKYPIIFCENSGYDLSEIKKEFDDKLDLECIQFDSNLPFDINKGKGYNEYLMIKGGVIGSEKIRECTHFLKITGRYAMLNICEIIKEIEMRAEEKVFMGDIKDTNFYQIIGSKNTGHWGDSRFWVAKVNFYKSFMIECYKEMNDYIYGKWAEDFILKFSREHRKDKRFIHRFRHQVQFDGVSGAAVSINDATGNMNYNSYRSRIKNKIRYILRLLFPYIWF